MDAADDRLTRRRRQPAGRLLAAASDFVDWVGADIYSKFATPGIWSAFKHFYRHWGHFPFVVGEYSPWDNDYHGALHAAPVQLGAAPPAVRALIYYRSVAPNNAFDINHWPAARTVLRDKLNSRRFRPYAPGTRP